MKWKNEKKIDINAVFVMDENKGSVADVFEEVYEAKNYTKWFNWKPFVWMVFDKERLDVGCTGTVHFTVPPFKYSLSVVDVKENEFIEFATEGRLFNGTARMEFYAKNGKVYFEDPHVLQGKNVLIHNYYRLFLSGNHVPFMQSRFKKLENRIMEKRRKDEVRI